jgi:death on curing protein
MHEEVLEDSPGTPGIRDEGLIESAVHAPVERAGGEDAYHRLLDKVAAVGFRLARGHGFVDGNKRTSLAVMAATLAWEGLYLDAWGDEGGTLVMSLLGAGHLDQQGLKHALILGCALDPTDANLP